MPVTMKNKFHGFELDVFYKNVASQLVKNSYMNSFADLAIVLSKFTNKCCLTPKYIKIIVHNISNANLNLPVELENAIGCDIIFYSHQIAIDCKNRLSL